VTDASDDPIGTPDPARPVLSTSGMDAYRELFEHSADAILIIEGETFIDCNDATVKMLRHARKADVLSTHPSQLSPPTQPDGRDSYEKANEMIALAFEQGSHRFEWDHLRADGDVFPVEVLLTAIQEPGRRVLHVVWRDISERKALEEQLRHAQKMEAIGRLAGGIAHDFNNLLVVIQGYADLIASRQDGETVTTRHLAQIQQASDRAAELVRQLLAFGRKQPVRPRVVDLNEVLRENLALLKPLVGDQVKLDLELCEQPLHIRSDPGQLEQILMNLTANARDAMPDGGHCCIETRPVKLTGSHIGTSRALAPGPYALLALSDSGVGMDPSTAAMAFEPFFTTKQVGEGSGLGLATVYGIVQQGDGAVELISTPGLGTTVKVYLPMTGDDLDGLDQDLSPAALHGRGETILVVEDEQAVSRIVVSSLKSLGYETILATNGREALDLHRRHQDVIDLILSDVMMPHMTGPEFIAELAKAGHDPAVLFMSGYTNNALAHVSSLPREVDLLEKPFRRDVLAQHVARALEQSRERGLG
jgi:PAS domain S-box-containing protein